MATTHRIAEALRVRRAFTGQDQKELAKEIGISQPTISQIEDGRSAD
jgi:DNA-binding XRE family transcriptional regulator